MRRARLAAGLALAALAVGCGHGARAGTALAPAPVAQTASSEELDALWNQAVAAFRHGKWKQASELFGRVNLEFPPGDPRIAQSRFYLGEVQFARGENLDAVRQFRRVSDEAPNDPLAPEALLRVGDAYADLWHRPELDPTYGQTALAAYEELVSRYPDTPAALRAKKKIERLQDWFAIKDYKAALYYLRYKAYESAIIYLRDLVAKYPRASVAPQALVKLVGAYRKLGYKEEEQETCGYLRRFHPKAAGVDEVCPAPPAGTS